MQHPSTAYRDLNKALSDIEHILSRMPINDCSTPLQHLKIQSFILMAHSAFEEYLESVSKMAVNAAVDAFNKNGVVSLCVVSLIVTETIAQLDDAIARRAIRTDVVRDLTAFVNVARQNHMKLIGRNHGIRTTDQKALLLPVGFDPVEVDAATSANLDAFGSRRGAIAHRVSIRTEETKSSIVGTATSLLQGLGEFDRAACASVSKFMKTSDLPNVSDLQL